MEVNELTGEIKGPLELFGALENMARQMPMVNGTDEHFLPDTKLPVVIYNYWLRGGGIGDRVCSFPALIWIAKTRPWVWGRVWVAPSMVEFADNIIGQLDRPDWIVRDIRTELPWADGRMEDGSRVTGRGIGKDALGNKVVHAGATGAGGSLVQMGFVDHTGRYNAPEGWDYMPVIDFDRWFKPLPYKDPYVVFTTGAVAPARSVPGKYWNPIIDHVIKLGLIPVFLGKSEIIDMGIETPLRVAFEDGCDYHKGVDLRDKTTLMEAAWIMKNAQAVIGLDNGLLNLAACTDASIICAYNTVDPMDRLPKRRAGRWITLSLTKEELRCSGCQTFMGGIAPPHNFRDCLYGHKRCVDLLFADQGARWKRALDEILA